MQVMVRWRDDGKHEWQTERMQEVKPPLDWLYFHTPAIYRTRQYEISFTENASFSLITMEEEAVLLEY